MSGGSQAAIQELAERIDQADAIVIGGGSGLSGRLGGVRRNALSWI